MNLEAHLIQLLTDFKKDKVDQSLKLIREDAPKNKFAVIAGELRMIEVIEQEIMDFVKDSAKKP